MSANSAATAPPGRKKLALGKERSDAAPGHASQNRSSPERAKEGSWPVVPLGELAADERNAITDGPFGSKLKTEHYTSAGPRVIRLKNVGDVEFVDAKAYISEAHFLTLQKHRVFPGDIVIAALGENPPRSCLIPESVGPAVVKADCIRFKAGPRVLPKFLNYVLNAPDLRRHAKGIIHGVGRPRLNLGEIKALPIPLPPVDEQQEIVAEIEKQFTRLEAGVSALRRVQANLKRYRAAVLKAACEGKLVPTEAELSSSQPSTKNSQPAYESGEQLLKRILAERRQKWAARGKYKEPAVSDIANLPPLPEGWTWASLEQLSVSSSYGTSAKCSYENSGPAVLRIPNIADGRIGLADLKFAGPTETIATGDELAPGDLLIIRTNGSKNLIGRSALVREKLNRPTDYASYLIRFRLVRESTLFTWVAAIWDSSFLRAWIEQRAATSAGQHNISMTVLSTLPIALPPLAEQTRIVAEVERRLSLVQELESVVSVNLQRAIRLRQSVLQQAFNGNLIKDAE